MKGKAVLVELKSSLDAFYPEGDIVNYIALDKKKKKILVVEVVFNPEYFPLASVDPFLAYYSA